MNKIIVAVLMLCSSLAFAETKNFVGEPLEKVHVLGTGWKHKKPTFNFIGVQLDAGAPDGVGVDIVGSPIKYLRLNVGVPTDLVSAGIRAGATISMFYWITPSATIEGGHMFAGNFNKLVSMFGGNTNEALLNNVDYDWVNFHGGLELGHPNWFVFFIHAGMSYFATQTHGLNDYIRQRSGDLTFSAKDVPITVWTPSAKLGFIIWL